jgi:hypothetical protein
VKPYLVIKKIKGNRYYYWQRTWREGKKVKTWNQYVGPVNKVARPISMTPSQEYEAARQAHRAAAPFNSMIDTVRSPTYKAMKEAQKKSSEWWREEKRHAENTQTDIKKVSHNRSAPRPATTYQAIDHSITKMPNPPQFIMEDGMIKQVYPFPVFTSESCGKDVIEDPKHPGICLECYNPDGTERRPSWEE